MTEVNIKIDNTGLTDQETTRKYFTKIVNGRMIHADAEGDDVNQVTEKGFFIVLPKTMIQFIQENCRIPAHWEKETIYHLYKGAWLGAIEVWIDTTERGYICKYFNSQKEIETYYKGLRRSKILADML